jgi:hypothetical protein
MPLEPSILKSTKKLLGIHESDLSFDLDILIFINSAFATLQELGVNNGELVVVEDDLKDWSETTISPEALPTVKTYVYLKVRMMFDAPSTSFAITAMEKILEEQEWRLREFHDDTAATTYPPDPIEEVV